MSAKLLILGIDALDPEFFARHQEQLPNLNRLIKKGSSGRLRSTVPPFTGPAWTSAFSGMNPGKTGILNFTESRQMGQATKVLDSCDVAVPRIWNVLNEQGKKTAVVGVPMAYPVEKINGMMVSGFMTPSNNVTFTYPEDLQVELEKKGYIPSLDLQMDKSDEEYVDLLYATAKIKYDLTLSWLENETWDAFIVVLSEPDWIQHRLDVPEQLPSHAHNEQILLEYFQFIDTYVAQFVTAAGEGAHTLICSDHGFGHFIYKNVHVNNFLRDKGYFFLKQNWKIQVKNFLISNLRAMAYLPGYNWLRKQIPHKAKVASLKLADDTLDSIDWEKTTAYFQHSMSIIGTISINRTLFPDEDAYHTARKKLKEELLALNDPDTQQPVFREIYLREEIYSGPFMQNHTDIVALFNEGYGGNNALGRQLISMIPIAGMSNGTHRQDGMWILSGPDIKADHQCHLDLQDIAPIAYHLLGSTVPSSMDGTVPKEIFDPESSLSTFTCETLSYAFLKREFVGLGLDDLSSSQQEEIIEHLQSLGYIE